MSYEQADVNLLIRRDLRPRGVTDSRVLAALTKIPREQFVPEELRHRSYENSALPIGRGQTISQPLMVGLMLQMLDVQPESTVLEVGTGSGYQAALLATMARRVVTVERISDLAADARKRLAGLGLENVTVVTGDGSLGYEPESPYDRIIVACGAPAVPESLKKQLGDGGIMVVPVGNRDLQEIAVVRRSGAEFETVSRDACVFVPLVGSEGWPTGGAEV